MIDEADEFVSGPQNRSKRPMELNVAGIPKRRRCMSPLLKEYPPTSSTMVNHSDGKGPPLSPVIQPQADLIKPVAVVPGMGKCNSINAEVIGLLWMSYHECLKEPI